MANQSGITDQATIDKFRKLAQLHRHFQSSFTGIFGRYHPYRPYTAFSAVAAR
jgi:hypothetical protein